MKIRIDILLLVVLLLASNVQFTRSSNDQQQEQIKSYMNVDPSWGLSIRSNQNTYQSSIISNEMIQIIDSNSDVWVPKPIEFTVSSNIAQIEIKTNFYGSLKNGYEIKRNESLYQGNCIGKFCCDSVGLPLIANAIAYNNSIPNLIYQMLPAPLINITGQLSVLKPVPLNVPFSPMQSYQSSSLNVSVYTDISDLTWLNAFIDNYYLVLSQPPLPLSPKFIAKSYVGDSPQKIGMSTTTYNNQPMSDVCSKNTVATSTDNPYDQFAVASLLESILTNCTLNLKDSILSTQLGISTQNVVVLNCPKQDLVSLHSIWFNSQTYPIVKSSPLPTVKNVGVDPILDEYTTITNLYIDIENIGSGLSVYSISLLNCCSTLGDCEPIKYQTDPKQLLINSGKTSRLSFTIRSFEPLNPSQYCNVGIIGGIKQYEPVKVDFSTTTNTYIPDPQYLSTVGTCPSGTITLSRQSKLYCIPTPRCTMDQVADPVLGLCRPKPTLPSTPDSSPNLLFYSTTSGSLQTVPGCDGFYDPSTNTCTEFLNYTSPGDSSMCETNLSSSTPSDCVNTDGVSFNETVIMPGSSSKVLNQSGLIIIILLVVVVVALIGLCVYRCFFKKSDLEKTLKKLKVIQAKESFIFETNQKNNQHQQQQRNNNNNQGSQQPTTRRNNISSRNGQPPQQQQQQRSRPRPRPNNNNPKRGINNGLLG
ncbi:hypothetical protein DFA_07078 [Cavenderia fasciculata]|uniref:Uncharacterized protein n=1 Tax=Cavenderia fasciculata TaxID=261658 RepID=F4PVF3_CACFS|nr:uncharacterized protein DFA_07078 [Cavenderia fasciculata]EGG19967.1 hypothetical protein DFA_07078 [Cavenderia fasciculata]|eukprot:XP_004366950.1 hypothetical protein DFA_07078 [Cavenderia fasciculata]